VIYFNLNIPKGIAQNHPTCYIIQIKNYIIHTFWFLKVS